MTDLPTFTHTATELVAANDAAAFTRQAAALVLENDVALSVAA